MRSGTLLALALVLAASQAGAAMYKWTDSQGRTQYGQFPPTGIQAERITAAGTRHRVDPQENLSPQQRLEQLEEQKKQQEEQEAEAEAVRQRLARRENNCQLARKNLAVLQEVGHHRVRLPDGTVTYLTDEQKQQRIADTKRQIEDNCD
jgi:hypothetical protein